MKLRETIGMAMFVIVGFTSPSVLADDERKSPLVANNERDSPIIGLWEGIDLDDGASHLRSIRRNEDGTFSLTGNATFLMLCGGTDRGLINGTGVFENGVLKTNLSVTCFNDGRIIPGLESTMVLDRKNGTLTEQRLFGVPEPLIFHLISSPLPKY